MLFEAVMVVPVAWGVVLVGAFDVDSIRSAEPTHEPLVTDDEMGDEIETLDELEFVSFEGHGWYDEDHAQVERCLTLLFPRTVRPGSLLLVVAHRTRQGVGHNPWHDYLGLDAGGLKVGLGVRYGVLQGLDFGVWRLNGTAEAFDSFEIDGRYQVLHQAQHHLDLALRGGISWFSQQDRQDALGGFAQLAASRIFLERLLAGVAFLYHSDSSGARKKTNDTDYSAAVAAALEVRLSGSVALAGEMAMGLVGYHARYPAWSGGVKIYTHRHTFAVVLGNTQYMGSDGLVANAWRGRWRQLVVGFNITRELLDGT